MLLSLTGEHLFPLIHVLFITLQQFHPSKDKTKPISSYLHKQTLLPKWLLTTASPKPKCPYPAIGHTLTQVRMQNMQKGIPREPYENPVTPFTH